MDGDQEAVAVLGKKTLAKKRTRDVPDVKPADMGGARQKRNKAVPVARLGKMELRDDNTYARSAPKSFKMESDDAGPSRSSKARCKPIKPSNVRLIPTHPHGILPMAHPFFVPDAFPSGSIDQSTSSSENSPLTASFCSSQSSDDGMAMMVWR